MAMINKTIDWGKIPFDQRQAMLKMAGLLDDKGKPSVQLTRQVKMMVTQEYYHLTDSKVRPRVITK